MTKKRKPGRPKGSRNQATIVREVGRMLTTISQGEEAERVTIAEAMVRLLERRTMTGDVAADRTLTKLRARVAPEAEKAEVGILLVPEQLTPEEWVRRAEILNRFCEKPEMPPGEPDNGPGNRLGDAGSSGGGSTSGPAPSGGPKPHPPGPPPRNPMRNRLIR